MKAPPIRDKGTATAGIRAARTEPRERNMTTSTMSTASSRVLNTSSIESWMNTLASYGIKPFNPLGNWPRISGSASWISLATVSGLAPGAGSMPMKMAVLSL